MGTRVELNPGGLRAIVSPGGIVGEHMHRTAVQIADRARQLAPSSSGTLARSIVVRQARNTRGQYASGWDVSADAPYALWAHEGRPPGKMPPDAPIRAWVEIQGMEPTAVWPIRRKIGDEGTTGTPFLTDALLDVGVE